MRLHRFEVITGNGGRWRWLLAEKRAIVAESFAPGAVASEVARRHGLRPQQVFGWRAELRKLAEAARTERADADAGLTLTFVPAVATSAATSAHTVSASASVPALVAPAADASPGALPTGAASPVSSIEISLGKTVVRVHGAADAALLTAVLKTLKVRS